MTPDNLYDVSSHPEFSREENLKTAILHFREVFEHDLNLVAESAQHHGVRMTQGGIFDRPIHHAYSLRIPGDPEQIEAEIQRLKRVKKIAFLCMDYRQVGEAAENIDADAVIANAGGPAQPDQQRFNASMELIRAVVLINPAVEIDCCGHVKICGGANYFTQGKMKKLYEKNSQKEMKEMGAFVNMFKKAAKRAGARNITAKLALIKADDTFDGLKRI